MNLNTAYLILTFVGAAIPIAFFVSFGVEQGIDPVGFIEALFASGAAGGFTADLLISSLVFWMYMFSDQSSGPKPWLFIVLNLCIGLSCALPAYLWAKTRARG